MAAKSGAALNWKGLDKALGKATHSLAHTQALMESIGEGLVSGTRQRFRDEEAPDGQDNPADRGFSFIPLLLQRRGPSPHGRTIGFLVFSSLPLPIPALHTSPHQTYG